MSGRNLRRRKPKQLPNTEDNKENTCNYVSSDAETISMLENDLKSFKNDICNTNNSISVPNRVHLRLNKTDNVDPMADMNTSEPSFPNQLTLHEVFEKYILSKKSAPLSQIKGLKCHNKKQQSTKREFIPNPDNREFFIQCRNKRMERIPEWIKSVWKKQYIQEKSEGLNVAKVSEKETVEDKQTGSENHGGQQNNLVTKSSHPSANHSQVYFQENINKSGNLSKHLQQSYNNHQTISISPKYIMEEESSENAVNLNSNVRKNVTLSKRQKDCLKRQNLSSVSEIPLSEHCSKKRLSEENILGREHKVEDKCSKRPARRNISLKIPPKQARSKKQLSEESILRRKRNVADKSSRRSESPNTSLEIPVMLTRSKKLFLEESLQREHNIEDKNSRRPASPNTSFKIPVKQIRSKKPFLEENNLQREHNIEDKNSRRPASPNTSFKIPVKQIRSKKPFLEENTLQREHNIEDKNSRRPASPNTSFKIPVKQICSKKPFLEENNLQREHNIEDKNSRRPASPNTSFEISPKQTHCRKLFLEENILQREHNIEDKSSRRPASPNMSLEIPFSQTHGKKQQLEESILQRKHNNNEDKSSRRPASPNMSHGIPISQTRDKKQLEESILQREHNIEDKNNRRPASPNTSLEITLSQMYGKKPLLEEKIPQRDHKVEVKSSKRPVGQNIEAASVCKEKSFCDNVDEEPTVIYKWTEWSLKMIRDQEFCITGKCNGIASISEDILHWKRIDAHTLMNPEGNVMYKIVGMPDHYIGADLPSFVRKKFQNGFPEDWNAMLNLWHEMRHKGDSFVPAEEWLESDICLSVINHSTSFDSSNITQRKTNSTAVFKKPEISTPEEPFFGFADKRSRSRLDVQKQQRPQLSNKRDIIRTAYLPLKKPSCKEMKISCTYRTVPDAPSSFDDTDASFI